MSLPPSFDSLSSPPPSFRQNSRSGVDAEVVFAFSAPSGKKGKTAPKMLPIKGSYQTVAAQILKDGAFQAAPKSVRFVRLGFSEKEAQSSKNLLLAGLGTSGEVTEEISRRTGAAAWATLTAEKSQKVSILVDSLLDGLVSSKAGQKVRGGARDALVARLVRGFAEGMAFSSYRFNKYQTGSQKKENVQSGLEKIYFVSKSGALQKKIKQELIEVQASAEAMNLCRDWSNEPSNHGTPEFFANEARKHARQLGVKCRILSEKDAAREKMNLFLGVGQGSVREGKVVILDYVPKKKPKKMKTIVFVGKGITFDSGGISLKPSGGMEDMKHDMTGAATMAGAFSLAAKWKVPNRVVCILGFTENMPGGKAIQPGNVIQSRAGKTVEINNTDAEGRLILADLLDYAHQFKPDAILDAATLTGAVGTALGNRCAAIMGNNESLIGRVKEASEAHFERLWQLPLFEDYLDDIKSEIADLKNIPGNRLASTITAGKFLEQFIRPEVPWVHLDIAYTAFACGVAPYYPKKGASGQHVRTLAQFAADF